MYDRIIVPVPEGAGPDALDRPRTLARVLGCELTLLHVHQPREAPAELEGLPQYRYQHVVETWDKRDGDAEAREVEWLAGLADEVRSADPGLEVGSRVVLAPLARCVHAEGERVLAMVPAGDPIDPDLDVAAQELIRTCGIPVLLHRPDMEILPIRRILVTLDGSSFSEEALVPAVELARVVGARLTLAEVVTRHSGLVRMFHPAERTADAAERSLRVAAEHIPPSLGPVEMRVVEHGSAAGGILDEARRDDIDLIVMATHGRGGLRRIMLGSVAESVVAASPIPVLVYRPQAMGVERLDADRGAGSLA